MSKNTPLKKELNKKIKEFLIRTTRLESSNRSYNKPISVFKNYFKRYEFDEDLMYQFGMIYDHLGQKFRYLSLRSTSKGKKKDYLKKSDEYFRKAMDIYKTMLKTNPKSYWAIYGIGKVYRAKRNFKKALYYAKKAYRMSKGDISGVGVIYQKMGDDKKALEWFKKELRDRGENDYGALINFISISNRRYREKMRRYAENLKRHFDRESQTFKKTRWGKSIKHEIERIMN